LQKILKAIKTFLFYILVLYYHNSALKFFYLLVVSRRPDTLCKSKDVAQALGVFETHGCRAGKVKSLIKFIQMAQKIKFFSMKNFYLSAIILSSFSLTKCNVHKKDIEGVFVQKKDNRILIVLKDDKISIRNTYRQLDAPPFNFCDTTTFGDWELIERGKLIKFNSDNSLGGSELNFLDFNVKELQLKDSDSIIIKFNNPIESGYLKTKNNTKELIYSCFLFSDFGDLNSQITENNIATFIKPDSSLNKIVFEIYPNYNFKGRNVGVRVITNLGYKFKNPKSNYFEINMPNLSYNYLTYLRFNGEFIRVIDKDHLEWQGEIYVKKKKGA